MDATADVPRIKEFARRPYLDGLRGIAILSVLLYHAGFGLRGGFVGVDVFFVLSGFLITSIAMRDMENGTFSLSSFWERRIRRIVPALSAVLLFSLLGAFVFVLYPGDLTYFGSALAMTAAFSSSLLFSTTGGYFDGYSHYSPLLHTWTLSVEEQFYILFPLLILACISFARVKKSVNPRTYILLTVAVISIFSFILSILAGYVFSETPFFHGTIGTAAFYVLPTRAWEIGIGAIIALIPFRLHSPHLAELLGFSGLVAILTSVFLLNDSVPFPGVVAILPTLGALAIILANESAPTRSGNWLSQPVLVWFGLISYSLYLWHWPLFSFAAFASPDELPMPITVCIIGISIIAAWLSYRFVETPFRTHTSSTKRSVVFLVGLGTLFMFFNAGVFVKTNANMFSIRIPTAAQAVLSATEPFGSQVKLCHEDGTGACRIGNHDGPPDSFLVWGDSQAHSFIPLFNEVAKSRNVEATLFYQGSCPPVLLEHYASQDKDCVAYNKQVSAYIDTHNPDTVILTALWNLYVPTNSDFATGMTKQINRWSEEGKTIYIIKQIPEQRGFRARDAFYHAVHTGDPSYPAPVLRSAYIERRAASDAVIDLLDEIPNVHVLDPSVILCDSESCPLITGAQAWYHDAFHLNLAGVMRLVPLFQDFLEPS